MTITFRPAVREEIALIIGLAGGTGSGKTHSALRLAKGMIEDIPGGRIALIDTERGRAKNKAPKPGCPCEDGEFEFDHAELEAPFTPAAYVEAICEAEAQKYPVIIVDSMSHVHAGVGGMLDQQEDILNEMAGTDPKRRNACLRASWIKPKRDHKRMVDRLLQLQAHLILCFRAEPKTEMVKESGKWEMRPKQTLIGLDGWVPICEKLLPYELTASFMLMADQKGVGKAIKVEQAHLSLFPEGKVLDEAVGRAIAAWARGDTEHPAPVPSTGTLTPEQLGRLRAKIVAVDKAVGVDQVRFAEHFGITRLEDLPFERFAEAMSLLERKRKG